MKLQKICWALFVVLLASSAQAKRMPTGEQDRKVWVNTLTRIVDPVLNHLANGTLRASMPLETRSKSKPQYAHLEAVGRTICGLAPWLELGEDDTKEGQLRAKYIALTLKGLANAVDPASPDYLIFNKGKQPLVDAAFLAQGLLRAPTQLWGRLDKQTQDRLVKELKSSRVIKPNESNWLLFASIIEATLLEFTGECNQQRMLYGVNKFLDQWYVGDAQYGDGEFFHLDYYNSYVIQPMLLDVLVVMKKHGVQGAEALALQQSRLTRYAEQQERLISPEGAYPVVGRSITYRNGAFQVLTQAALMHLLPKGVAPAQVRCALTAVIKRQFKAPANFDKEGWLRVGFTGEQLEMSEYYINTGSEYLCTFGFLALGLPATDKFWADPYTPWTGVKAWNGEKVKADHSIKP